MSGETTTTGQAPAADPAQAAAPTAPAAIAPATPAAPAATPPTGGDERVAKLEKDLADARREAAANRVAKNEGKTELEKLQAGFTQLVTSAQNANTKAAIATTGQGLGLIDPDLALLAIKSQIVYNDDHEPTNVAELLTGLKASKAFLFGGAAAATAHAASPQVPAGSPTNPAAGSGAAATPSSFTRAQLKAMTPAEYEKNQVAINEALRQGLVRE
jgi:hypothetical protein